MFKAVSDAETLKSITAALSSLVKEVKMTVTADGIGIRAVDAAHVAMLDMQLHATMFASFEATPCEIGADVEKLKSIVALAPAKSLISMEYKEDKGNLTFKIENLTRRMNTIDTSNITDVKMPEFELCASAEIPSVELQKAFKATADISDHVSMIFDKDGFTVKGEGDTDSVDMCIPTDKMSSVNIGKDAKSMFPLDYLTEFVKTLPKGTPVTLHLDTDMPLIASYLINEHGVVTYLLAPRIENE